MTAVDVLSELTRRQVDRLFDAVRSLPADRIDWSPGPNTRSALDQLQEIATVTDSLPDAIRNRKLEFSDQEFAEWVERRKQLTDLADLERRIRDNTESFIAFMQTIRPEELDDTIAMPWPGDFRVYSLLHYHLWNMGYHEGQIYMLGTLLANES